MGKRERCWKVFPREGSGGCEITVAVASGVATWLHCSRSPSGIQGARIQEDNWSSSQSLIPKSQTEHFCRRIYMYAQIKARPRAGRGSLVMLRHGEVGCVGRVQRALVIWPTCVLLEVPSTCTTRRNAPAPHQLYSLLLIISKINY